MQPRNLALLSIFGFLLPNVSPTIILPTLTVTASSTAVAAAGLLVGAAGLVAGKIALLAGLRPRKRHGRSLEDPVSDKIIENMLTTAAELDSTTHCSMRLVCELASLQEEQLASDESLLMSLFITSKKLETGLMIQNVLTPFHTAAYLGQRFKDKKVCANKYKLCPYDASLIMDTFRHQNTNK